MSDSPFGASFVHKPTQHAWNVSQDRELRLNWRKWAMEQAVVLCPYVGEEDHTSVLCATAETIFNWVMENGHVNPD